MPPKPSSRVALLLCLGTLLLGGLEISQPAGASDLQVEGYLAARGQQLDSPPSWLQRGFGRLGPEADGPGEDASSAGGQGHLVLNWRPGQVLGAHVHLLGRLEPSAVAEGQSAGVFEAYLRGSFTVGQGDRLRFRLGHFLLPTSKENVELAWSSPYTLTLSAINSWIADEVRLTGLLSEYQFAIGPVHKLVLGATVFGGNDTAGALLAWRGWSLGERLTTFGEVLPLPALHSLEDDGAFGVQLDRGTQPFGSDLDSRPGWAAYLHFRLSGQYSVQYSYYDNRGDRALHNGDEYAWNTGFHLLGGEYFAGPWSFAGEVLKGSTGMGLGGGPRVQADFESAYALASVTPGPFRLTLRYDTFEVEEGDFTRAEDNTDDGEAWTFAVFWEPRDDFRLGLEWVDVEGVHPAAADSGFDAVTDGQSLVLEVRYYFGL